jgi:zinc protease
MYTNDGYTLEVKGVEDINGKSCYKLLVTKPSGTKSTEYYDKETFLKVKEIQVQTTQGETATNIIEYADYKAVDGITLPHTMSISGPMPMPLVMKATAIKLNGTVDPMLFKI